MYIVIFFSGNTLQFFFSVIIGGFLAILLLNLSYLGFKRRFLGISIKNILERFVATLNKVNPALRSKNIERKKQLIVEKDNKLNRTQAADDSLIENNKTLKKQLQSKEQEIDSLKQTISQFEQTTNDYQEMINSEGEGLGRSNQVRHCFYSEVMVTAGPRKRLDRDVAFGEDTCGIVQASDKILFWLLDGTSDQEYLYDSSGEIELFSSRLMVQSISKALPNVFKDHREINAQELTQRAITKVANDWVGRYGSYGILKEGKSLKCSTTLIVGTLDIKGNLDAFIVGDSKLLLFDINQECKLPIENTGSNQDFIAEVSNNRLSLFTGRNDKDIREQGALGSGRHIEVSNVWSIICHSDGISERRSQIMQKKREKGFSNVRDALSKIPVNTKDDKSLLIVEITNC